MEWLYVGFFAFKKRTHYATRENVDNMVE